MTKKHLSATNAAIEALREFAASKGVDGAPTDKVYVTDYMVDLSAEELETLIANEAEGWVNDSARDILSRRWSNT